MTLVPRDPSRMDSPGLPDGERRVILYVLQMYMDGILYQMRQDKADDPSLDTMVQRGRNFIFGRETTYRLPVINPQVKPFACGYQKSLPVSIAKHIEALMNGEEFPLAEILKEDWDKNPPQGEY